jgi:hypothetical protein
VVKILSQSALQRQCVGWWPAKSGLAIKFAFKVYLTPAYPVPLLPTNNASRRSQCFLYTIPILANSCAANFPGNIFDAHFFVGLFIVVEPFSVSQFNSSEFCARVNTLSKPFTL